MFKILRILFKDFHIMCAAYSNNIFPEPLSSKEEKVLLDKMNNGDSKARDKLIEHNLRLVAHIVKKYDNKNEDIDDLISIGTIGLIKGIDSFNSSKNAKITTYISKCIENEILMYYRANKHNNKNISLNEHIGYDKEGDEITLLDILKTPAPDYILDIHTQDNIKLLNKYLNILNKREKEIISKRYGLDNNNKMTQREIAKEFNISRSYVSRIEKRALSKILKEYKKK